MIFDGDYIHAMIRRDQEDLALADQWRWAQCGIPSTTFSSTASTGSSAETARG